jgi:hypothetical protein
MQGRPIHRVISLKSRLDFDVKTPRKTPDHRGNRAQSPHREHGTKGTRHEQSNLGKNRVGETDQNRQRTRSNPIRDSPPKSVPARKNGSSSTSRRSNLEKGDCGRRSPGGTRARRSGVKDPNGEGGSWRRYMWRFYWGGLEGKEMKRGACVSAGLLLLALPSFLQFSLSLSPLSRNNKGTILSLPSL